MQLEHKTIRLGETVHLLIQNIPTTGVIVAPTWNVTETKVYEVHRAISDRGGETISITVHGTYEEPHQSIKVLICVTDTGKVSFDASTCRRFDTARTWPRVVAVVPGDFDVTLLNVDWANPNLQGGFLHAINTIVEAATSCA